MLGVLSASHLRHRLAIPAALLLLLFSGRAVCGQSGLASLHGKVRDGEGNTVADASVELQKKDSANSIKVATDSTGGFTFASLEVGTYTLRASKNGLASAAMAAVVVDAGENQAIELTLVPANQNPSQVTGAPQFFDEPQFSVAGVTDTTALGGHGPDTVVRTRNSLAKDTLELGKSSTDHPADDLQPDQERALRKSAQAQPADFNANHALGKWLLAHGKAKESVSYFEVAARAKPSDYQNAYDWAAANAAAGNYLLAHDEAADLVAGHDTAELHHLLGDVCEKLGDSLQAVRQYQRAAELSASEANIFDWGAELLLHHAPEPAEEVFSRGHRLFPGSERMWLGQGASLFAEGAYEQAAQEICRASDLYPEDPVPYLFLGKMQSAEVAPSTAVVERLHRFQALHPESAQANYFYAIGLWKQQKTSPGQASPAQIESLLSQAIRLDPQAAPAHLQLGIVRAEENNEAGAIEEFERAAQIDPQMEEAHYRLALAYRRQGEPEKSKSEFARYQQLAKADSEKLERERHEIQQFVYRLRDPGAPPVP
jgi:tetratricopeptide (TPR) repeat protein